MKKLIALMVLASILEGCATVVKISPEDVQSLYGREITSSRHSKPNFFAMTRGESAAGFVLGGGIGFGIASTFMAREGNAIVEKNHIEDPSANITNKIIENLSKKYNVKNSNRTVEIDYQEDENYDSNLIHSGQNEDLIIDIKTLGWGIRASGDSLTKYHAFYHARLRLVDPKTSRVLADQICNARADHAFSATYDELLANDAEKIKKELQHSTEYCINYFDKKVFLMNE